MTSPKDLTYEEWRKKSYHANSPQKQAAIVNAETAQQRAQKMLHKGLITPHEYAEQCCGIWMTAEQACSNYDK